jgi:hypothetical protein
LYLLQQHLLRSHTSAAMGSDKVKSILETVSIVFTVYAINTLQPYGKGEVHELVPLKDFTNETEAELYVMANYQNYYSLTVLKRYE